MYSNIDKKLKLITANKELFEEYVGKVQNSAVQQYLYFKHMVPEDKQQLHQIYLKMSEFILNNQQPVEPYFLHIMPTVI